MPGRHALVSGEQEVLEDAIEHVRQAIVGHLNKPELRVSIEVWNDGPWGVRVAEISGSVDGPGGPASVGSSGWSYLQSDLPHGLAVCAQAERAIVTRAFMNDESETEREIENLLLLIDG